MKPAIPMYKKYTINYELSYDIGKKKVVYLYAEDEIELSNIIDLLLEFPIFHTIRKVGVLLETIYQKRPFEDDGNSKSPKCYFYWFNRKYYEFDENMKNYLLKNFEHFEEYEICDIIFKEY